MTETPDAKEGVRLRSWAPAVVTIGVLVVVLGGALAAARFLEDSASGTTPRADILIDVRPGEGPVGADRVRTGGPIDEVLDGSVEHVADSVSPIGVTELLRWEQITTAPQGPRMQFRCAGFIGATGSSATCGPADDDPAAGDPGLGWGQRVGGDGAEIISVQVSRAEEAAWIVVETDRRVRVAGRVIDGMSHVEWDSEAGEMLHVVLLDERFGEVWSGRPDISFFGRADDPRNANEPDAG